MPEQVQLSADEMAAQMADRMLRKSGQDPIPKERGGESGAEGGFTPQIGGKVIDADAQKSQEGEDDLDKAQKVGSAMTGEPGRQGQQPATGTAITDEPKSQDGSPSPGGGNVSENEDAKIRARKSGQIGVSGGSTGGGMSENEDDNIRARKAGKVGISKAEAIEMGLSKAQFQAMLEKGLIKADEDDLDEMEPEEKSCGAKKSQVDEVDADALIKSLQTLEAIAQGSTIPASADRRAELAERLADGTLSKSEMQELSELMKAAEATAQEDELFKSEMGGDLEDDLDDLEGDDSFSKSWSTDPEMQDFYDVSSYLEKHNQLTAAALDEVQGRLSKSLEDHRDRTQTFNTQLAKSLMGMAQLAQAQGEMIKGLKDRLETVEQTPLPRRGISQVSHLEKSMPGEVGVEQGRLSKDQIMDTLEELALKSDVAPCGEPLMRAVAMFEQSGQLSKSLYRDVVAHRKSTGN